MFTSESHSLFKGIVSKFHIFVGNNSKHFCIFQMRCLIVTVVQGKIQLETIPENNQNLSPVNMKLLDKIWGTVALILLSYKLKVHVN